MNGAYDLGESRVIRGRKGTMIPILFVDHVSADMGREWREGVQIYYIVYLGIES